MPLYKGCARAAQLRARVASTLIRAAVPGCRSITSPTSWTSQSAIEYGGVQSTRRKQMNPPPAEIGVPVAEVETPALIIDLDALDRNIAKMAEFAKVAGVRVRPHAKTHKSTAIALRQIALGAVGQCVQKVGEAEVLVRGGGKGVPGGH